MKGEKFNIPGNKLRVLIAPLDWGLGHATRCIPIISTLIKQHYTVIVAAEGQIKTLLQEEFPDLQFIDLRGYRVKYSQYKFWMPVKMLLQLPKLIYCIYAEKRWLNKAVGKYKIDAVIADNRLGLSHKKIPCAYITHQLQIKTGGRFTESIVQKIHYHFINKYTRCWVPDAGGEVNLAGELSHPVVLPHVQVVYLGHLSRFEKIDAAIKYDLCVILSGPEPQRSIFEKIILIGLKDFKGSVFLLRGLPGNSLLPESNYNSLQIHNHLAAAELNLVLQQSKIIICRAGYTTIMDLVKLQKKAILVPTPGQTEQAYLACYLQEQNLFCSVQQKDFSVGDALKKAADFSFKETAVQQNNYEEAIEDFVIMVLDKNQ
jgi:uncharacterized protein (TIGR00661 family)